MRKLKINDIEKELELAAAASKTATYTLKLYVTGTTPNSLLAITNLKKICEEYLKGRFDLQVIDIYQQPALARGEQILAAPTLIKQLPLPIRRIIGNLSDTDKVLFGLDLHEKNEHLPSGKKARSHREHASVCVD
jgi:circadian clock protein KaiB